MADKKRIVDDIVLQIDNNISLHQYLKTRTEELITVAETINTALQNGNKLLVFGNGGSAADSQHIAAEMIGKFYQERHPLPAIALTVNTSILTAVGNDFGYQYVFSRQIEGLARKGDIAIGLSTSGNSKNVILALKMARQMGLTTIGLTGSEGVIKDMVDHCFTVPSTDTPRIQEAHITIGHLLCYLVEEMVCKNIDSVKSTITERL